MGGASIAKTASHGCNLIKVGSAVIRASNATARNRAWDPSGVQLTEFLSSSTAWHVPYVLVPFLPSVPARHPPSHRVDDISKSGKFLENAAAAAAAARELALRCCKRRRVSKISERSQNSPKWRPPRCLLTANDNKTCCFFWRLYDNIWLLAFFSAMHPRHGYFRFCYVCRALLWRPRMSFLLLYFLNFRRVYP